jgi:hypothetical protein
MIRSFVREAPSLSYLLDTKALPGRELASVWRVSQTIMS